jgi:hypothetical protein
MIAGKLYRAVRPIATTGWKPAFIEGFGKGFENKYALYLRKSKVISDKGWIW